MDPNYRPARQLSVCVAKCDPDMYREYGLIRDETGMVLADARFNENGYVWMEFRPLRPEDV